MLFEWDVAVRMTGNSLGTEAARSPSPRPRALVVLMVLLGLEAAALAAAAGYFIIELLVEQPASLANAIALAAVLAIGAVWVGFIVVGLSRRQAWTRAAVIVIQVLFIAVAIGSFQGPSPRPDFGAVLLIPAVLALILLFTKSVMASTLKRPDDPRTF
jgi:hypothetical protein